jgi:hypothetical protein
MQEESGRPSVVRVRYRCYESHEISVIITYDFEKPYIAQYFAVENCDRTTLFTFITVSENSKKLFSLSYCEINTARKSDFFTVLL